MQPLDYLSQIRSFKESSYVVLKMFRIGLAGVARQDQLGMPPGRLIEGGLGAALTGKTKLKIRRVSVWSTSCGQPRWNMIPHGGIQNSMEGNDIPRWEV